MSIEQLAKAAYRWKAWILANVFMLAFYFLDTRLLVPPSCGGCSGAVLEAESTGGFLWILLMVLLGMVTLVINALWLRKILQNQGAKSHALAPFFLVISIWSGIFVFEPAYVRSALIFLWAVLGILRGPR
jgi:hypothetical protein